MRLVGLDRKQRTRTGVLALGVAGMLFGGVFTAAPAPSDAAQCPPPGAPAPPGPTGSQCQGFIISDTATTVRKAKIIVHLRPTQVLTYVNTRSDWPPVVPLTPGEPWVNSINPSYVLSPPGSAQPYGLFKAVEVSALAFGSVPVTARIQIRQHEANGVISPIIGVVRSSGQAIVRPSGRYNFISTPHATGLLDVTISDVKVDQVPVGLASGCHTSLPATIALTARHGFFLGSATPPRWWWQPIQSQNGGGTPYGTVDIPSFTGCHSGADNLDPLLTAMVSGPNNPVVANQLEGAVDPSKLPPLGSVTGPLAPSIAALEDGLPVKPPARTSPGASPAFQTWAATDAGLPQNMTVPVERRGIGWTVNYIYSFFLADIERANAYPMPDFASKRHNACIPLQNDAIEMYMAAGGSIKVGTTTYSATHVSPDATFNDLMLKAAADVRALGAQCVADPTKGDWATVLAEVHAAHDRASALGVDPAWTDPPPNLKDTDPNSV